MPIEFKVVVLVMLGAIVASLGKAMFHMSSGPAHSASTVRALSWRIGLSVALFLLLLAGAWLRLISPHAGP